LAPAEEALLPLGTPFVGTVVRPGVLAQRLG
jgi:hypothetical protein